MAIAETLIEEIRQLPEPLQREVLDFAHFLRDKAARAELDNTAMAQQSSMDAIWNNQDDEVWNVVPTR